MLRCLDNGFTEPSSAQGERRDGRDGVVSFDLVVLARFPIPV
jgi:hypothetical protein